MRVARDVNRKPTAFSPIAAAACGSAFVAYECLTCGHCEFHDTQLPLDSLAQ
jgi:hypothetical protein